MLPCTGAVKISPSGILHSPAHLIAGRPLMEKERSVPGPTMRTMSVFSISALSGFIARSILE